MDPFKIRDKNFVKRVQDSFKQQQLMEFIKAELIDVGPGSCSIELPYSKNLSQQDGFFHAGIISTLADNASGYAAYSLMKADSRVLTVEFKINFMTPADGDKIIAEGKVIKNGKTLNICQSEVYVLKDQKKTLCALAQLTIMGLKPEENRK